MANKDDERSWLSRTIFPKGTEPDPRFTLANERTFLAWVRTALAFLAGAIALQAFEIPGVAPDMQRVGVIGAALAAALISLGAAVRWVRVERAMRTGRPLPVPGIFPLLATACFIGTVVIFVSVVTGG